MTDGHIVSEAATMWERFIEHLNKVRPLGTYGDGTHKSFIGSIESYRKIFMEANNEHD